MAGRKRVVVEAETENETTPKKRGRGAKTAKPPQVEITSERVDLGSLLSENKAPTQSFGLWIVGDTPLICHAWSQKAKLEMLKGQSGATQTAKDKRNPEEDFLNSLYEMSEGVYGFPVTAIKRAVLSCAHKDRGIPRTEVMQALWLDAEIVQTRAALQGARCDMPLVRIYGSKPEMREDMVRIGAGLRKTANLAYRAQFTTWAIKITGEANPNQVPMHAASFLFKQAGSGIGVGDWRNEKGGWFGSFHVANTAEEIIAWNKFAAGKGPLPKTAQRRARADIEIPVPGPRPVAA